jgi:hypothetical protein
MSAYETIDIPQANSLSVVGNLLALVKSGITEKRELARELPLDPREVDYYMHAARILGLANFEAGKPAEFTISEQGDAYLEALTPSEKRRLLGEAVRSAKIFRGLLQRYEERELDREKIAAFLVETTELNTTTARRRADTILAWLKQTRG